MPASLPSSSTFEHGRRGQIRRYFQKFTTTIRRGSKDSDAENNIPQSSVETNDAQEHSHDDTLFTNTIDADQLPTTREDPEEQSRPTPPVKIETFHVDRASVYQERVQKLRDRYGMNIAGSDRSTFPATARRVQKSARMRVHRSCHECGVDFGHGIHCRACHHRLCGECPRTPGRGIKEAMAQAREFPFHVVAEESSTSPDLPMTEAPAIVSDHLDVFNTIPSTSKQVSKPSTSLEPILAGNSYLPPLEVDDDVPDSAPFRIAYDFRHGKDKADISISPRSSRHVPYPIATVRDPILRAPSGVQRVVTSVQLRFTVMSTSSAPSQTGGSTGRAVSTPNRWPSRKLFKETVSILVGPNKEKYNPHKDLLCFYSGFFRGAFKGPFKEAAEGKIELPDVNPDIFEAFQVWLYSHSLRDGDNNKDSSKRPQLLPCRTLAQLWVFGDKYEIPLLQNDSTDALLGKLEEENQFDVTVVQIAYQNTMQGSCLRRLAIDFCVFRMGHQPGERTIFKDPDHPNWSVEALVDFARCMSEAWQHKLSWRTLPTRDRCHYHIHADGERC
ncbi:hypothetical protein KCU85_g604, partial [Aureobasidium melanogenum]